MRQMLLADAMLHDWDIIVVACIRSLPRDRNVRSIHSPAVPQPFELGRRLARALRPVRCISLSAACMMGDLNVPLPGAAFGLCRIQEFIFPHSV